MNMMGHWGVKSYENDDASDALDAGLEQVHGDAYEALMDDRNTMTFDEAQKALANLETLAASLKSLDEMFDAPVEEWDDLEKLAFAGVVVRHAEFGVKVPETWLDKAIGLLESESMDWDSETTVRTMRRQHEIGLLKSLKDQA